jgi:hypothetical protein
MIQHTINSGSEKATGGQPDGSTNRTINKRKSSAKSTATEAQYDRIDRAFDYVGKLISTLDFRKMGVIHPSGRIKEMNEKLGYYIPTVDQRTVIDDQGFAHPRIAFYELIDRPNQGCRP